MIKLKVLFILLAVLILTGCSNTKIETTNTLTEVEQTQTQPTIVELETINGEYRAVWNENYEYDKPLKIENHSEWVDFFNEHPESGMEDNFKKEFTKEFFEDNVLYAYVKSEPSGSILLLTKSVQLQNDILTLYMERIVPEVGTEDMATRICIFGISREKIKNVRTVNVLISEGIQSSSK